MKIRFVFSATAALLVSTLPALAQTADMARPLQENGPPVLRPPAANRAPVQVVRPAPAAPAGGPSAAIRSIVVTGNTVFTREQLAAVLGPASGQTYDLAGLSGLAQKLTAFYQSAGYPFARAYLPAQDLSRGELHIQVLEGHYGTVQAEGEPAFTQDAQRFLAPLQRGDIMAGRTLERVTLILDDQPGIRTRPIVKPGEQVGEGDLAVQVERDHRVTGDVGIDNYGSRFMGRNRAHVDVDVDSPFRLGDQLAAQALYTDAGMWFGSLAYATPIGYSGLRGRVGYAHSYYELSGNFSTLKATGTADVASASLSYPLVRQQLENIVLSAGFDQKRLHDAQDTVATFSDKSSSTLHVAANFDRRDERLGGPGVTYGMVSLTGGHLRLPAELLPTDEATARTAGSFAKVNLDIARIQSLRTGLDLYARASVQRSDKNLDASEKFGLGGIDGVRAYPTGEGYGDSGWLTQLELRYAVDGLVPYLFYDAGSVEINRSPWTAADNRRTIAGAGVGLRAVLGRFSVNMAIATRTQGGQATSDKQQGRAVFWAAGEYRF